jgi:hypothetical protein
MDAERDEDLLRYISDSITLIAQYTGGGEEALHSVVTEEFRRSENA